MISLVFDAFSIYLIWTFKLNIFYLLWLYFLIILAFSSPISFNLSSNYKIYAFMAINCWKWLFLFDYKIVESWEIKSSIRFSNYFNVLYVSDPTLVRSVILKDCITISWPYRKFFSYKISLIFFSNSVIFYILDLF